MKWIVSKTTICHTDLNRGSTPPNQSTALSVVFAPLRSRFRPACRPVTPGWARAAWPITWSRKC